MIGHNHPAMWRVQYPPRDFYDIYILATTQKFGKTVWNKYRKQFAYAENIGGVKKKGRSNPLLKHVPDFSCDGQLETAVGTRAKPLQQKEKPKGAT